MIRVLAEIIKTSFLVSMLIMGVLLLTLASVAAIVGLVLLVIRGEFNWWFPVGLGVSVLGFMTADVINIMSKNR